MSLSPIKRRRRRVSTPERHPYQLSSNTFLRSERVKSKPRSIHTFKSQNRRIHAVKPQEITVKICQCFEGSNKVVHFSGKVLDLDSSQPQSYLRQQARSAAAAARPQSPRRQQAQRAAAAGRVPQFPKAAGAKRRGRRRDQGPQQPRAPTSAQRPQPTTAPSQADRNNVTAGGGRA